MRIFFAIEELPFIHVGTIKVHKLVAVGHDPVVGTNVVRNGVLEVLVIKARSPVAGRLAFQDGDKALALHIGWDR